MKLKSWDRPLKLEMHQTVAVKVVTQTRLFFFIPVTCCFCRGRPPSLGNKTWKFSGTEWHTLLKWLARGEMGC